MIVTDSEFWVDLQAKILKLHDLDPKNPELKLFAIKCGDEGNWQFTGSPGGEAVADEFRDLVTEAAINAGTQIRGFAVDWWCKRLIESKEDFYIRDVISKSAALCRKLRKREIVLSSVVTDNGTSDVGPWRELYDAYSWLYDHSHDPLTVQESEIKYWKSHVRLKYNSRIDTCAKQDWESLQIRRKELNFAIEAMSYDLAVLQAKCVIDRGLRRNEAMTAFQDEAAECLKEITSVWMASCAQLTVAFENEAEELKELAEPFHRVGDDLRRLLGELPATSERAFQEAEPATECSVSGGSFQRRAAWLATRLRERSWNKHDVERNNGPSHKTVQKILNGAHVREDVLKKLADALSAAPILLKLPSINLLDIPTD